MFDAEREMETATRRIDEIGHDIIGHGTSFRPRRKNR